MVLSCPEVGIALHRTPVFVGSTDQYELLSCCCWYDKLPQITPTIFVCDPGLFAIINSSLTILILPWAYEICTSV